MLPLLYLLTSFYVDAANAPAAVRVAMAPKAITACAAVTKSDVELVLGRAVDRGTEQTAGLESTCDYAKGHGLVTITIQRLTTGVDLATEIQNLKETIPEGTLRDANGLGTRAFFMDIPGAGTQLHVLRGDRDYVLVSILGFGDAPQVTAAAESLARKALARI